MSSKIITLPTQLVNQIAAGEVVERPASVVKELVENSLDAGATHIEIVLKNGGIDLIEVRDNGEGITPGDLQKALEKYSTSKIKTLQDLYEVLTFGFRGEALASIASVSRFCLSSKQAGSTAGRQIRNTEDARYTEQDVAHEVGTTVRVEDLFYNTPARLNYLKQARSEYLKVSEYIQKMALIATYCSFSLIHDEKQVFYFSQDQDFSVRVTSVLGSSFSSHVLPLEYSFGGFRISGVITDPKISFAQKNKQILYVNGRIIQSPIISKAIADAYKRYIAHGNYPGYVIFVEVDPTQVDVNVHPRKMEVRFAAESSLFRSVYHAVENVLKTVSLVDQTSFSGNTETYSLHQNIAESFSSGTSHKNQYYTGSGTKFKHYSPYTLREGNPAQAGIDFSQAILGNFGKSDFSELKSESQEIIGGDIRETPLGRIIGQLHNSYIVVQTLSGLLLLDQHALAERVIYEKLAATSYTPQVQQLLGGIGMHLDTEEYETYESYLSTFGDMGFETEALSHQNIVIHTVPDFLKGKDIEEVFRSMLGDISHIGSVGLQEVRNKMWAYTACRSAIKFGDPLNIFEMNALLRDASIQYSSTCPHGRPVVYEIDLLELQKKYER